MKRALLIFIVVMGYTTIYCQSIKPDIVTSAGSFYSGETHSISWTIGECISETYSNSVNVLTQGYQQSVYRINTAVDFTLHSASIELYPNPATDFVFLNVKVRDYDKVVYELFDISGKCLMNGQIISEKTDLNLSVLPASSYLLNIFSSDKKLLKSFKIIKKNQFNH